MTAKAEEFWKMDKLYIVIPAYNEEENIDKVICDWYPIIEQHNGRGESRLVIIDDGSKDSTYAKLQIAAQTREYLVPLTKANGGHGAQYSMVIIMRWSTGQTTSFKLTPMGRLCRRNLNLFGRRAMIGTW